MPLFLRRPSPGLALVMLMALACGALAAQTNPEKMACAQETCPAFCRQLDVPRTSYGACVNQCKKSCMPTPPPNPNPITLTPKYLVLAVAYAPPGCTIGSTSQCATSNGSSVVDYGSSSSNGTKITTKDSFQLGLTISYDNSSILPGIGGGGSYGFQSTTSDSTAVTATKGKSFDWKVPGNGDGIDHGQDQFLLLLHPQVTLEKDSPNKILWYVKDGGALYEVYASELRNPASMRPSTKAVLQEAELTTDDYQQILDQDPFGGKVAVSGGRPGPAGSVTAVSSGTFTTGQPAGPALDPGRFWYTGFSFPYEPPLASAQCNNGLCNCSAITGSITNDKVSDTAHEVDGQTTVDLYGDAGVPKVWQMKIDTKMVWTSSSTTDNITEGKQTATATVTCPSTKYTGPQGLQLWYDERYGSFLFIPYDPGAIPMIHKGQVLDSASHAVSGQLVTMSYAGKTYRTYT
ncbi:MAG: hypothetical protein ACRD25_11675, partial [Terracidiphilus sp.]